MIDKNGAKSMYETSVGKHTKEMNVSKKEEKTQLQQRTACVPSTLRTITHR